MPVAVVNVSYLFLMTTLGGVDTAEETKAQGLNNLPKVIQLVNAKAKNKPSHSGSNAMLLSYRNRM